MNIAVFGLGFVGLTTALGFADKGFAVCGYDIDQIRRTEIANGKTPFLEPGLDDALVRLLNENFKVANSAQIAAKNADVIFFCVGTPAKDDGNADLTHLLDAIDSVTETASENCMFVIKSTVPPGTVIGQVIPHVRTEGKKNPIVVNPEFLREGKCWDDFINPDRIVCGIEDDVAKTVLAKIYSPFNAPIHFVSPSTAEFIKYMSNSLLASLISFSNEMALIADAIGGINISKAFRILHEDRRLVGAGINTYIYPGCGYGGYCLPKDTVALVATAKKNDVSSHILDSVICLNSEMPRITANKIEKIAGSKEEKIGILGLSFKAGSDDVRDSSAAKIISCLIKDGFTNIYAYDPVAVDDFQECYQLNITYCDNKENLISECSTIALVTAWEEFKDCNILYQEKKWIDCRYFFEDGEQ